MMPFYWPEGDGIHGLSALQYPPRPDGYHGDTPRVPKCLESRRLLTPYQRLKEDTAGCFATCRPPKLSNSTLVAGTGRSR